MSTKKEVPVKKVAQKETSKPDSKKAATKQQPEEQIVQPDPKKDDPQFHIKEEAKKGEPMPTKYP